MRTLLIDGDILIYKIATLNEEPTHWGEGLWTLHCDENICKAEVDRQIDELLDNLKADKYIVALTDKKNFRKDILPSYKDNRKQKRKPLALPFLRQHCIDNHNAVIIVSIDKDLYQIPAKVSKDGKTYEEISENEANYWHMMQTLTGDSTDGYSGCPKVGVKTAQKILGDHANVPLLDLWMRVLAAYAKVGYSTDEVLAQARVARILRNNDYNKETGGIKLWRTS